LKVALDTRYGPTAFDDHFGDLIKLQQSSSVREYQLQFEWLLSQVARLYEARNLSLKRPQISKDKHMAQRELTPPLPSSNLTWSKPLRTNPMIVTGRDAMP
jgi:hypothetical protein